MVLGSKFFTPFKKHIKLDMQKSQQTLLKLGLVHQIGSGLFAFLPLGYRVLRKIHNIISNHFTNMGFNEALFSNLQPATLWMQSGRYDAYGPEMMRVKDRHNNEQVLGPTAEEVFTDSIDFHAHYKHLPIKMFNIQSKFRDEIRPRGGLLRSREFIMCDGYSYHQTNDELHAFYTDVMNGYHDMFNDLGLQVRCVQQNDTGEIGGDLSHEFFAQSPNSDEELEIGHIFALGTKYTQHLSNTVYMGCYGVGVSRLLSVYAEVYGATHNNTDFIQWPASVAPFNMYIAGSDSAEAIDLCAKIHNIDPDNIYYRDTHERFSEKMVIGHLISAPTTVIIGDRELQAGYVLCNDKQMCLDEFMNRMHQYKAAGHKAFVDL